MDAPRSSSEMLVGPLPPVPWRAVGVLVAAAFLLRLALGWSLQAWLDSQPGRLCLIEGDANGYWELAGKLARGEEYSLYEPPRRIMRMPGFPAILASGRIAFHDSLWGVRALLALVGAAACAASYGLAREFVDERTALIALGLTAASPVLALFSVMLLSETAFALTIILSSWAGVRTLRSLVAPQCRWGVVLRRATLTGIACAAATYVRPSWLPVVAAFAVTWVAASLASRDVRSLPMIERRRRVLAALVCSSVALASISLALSPWIARNHRLTGRIIPTTLWMGPSLYDGLHPGATGSSDMRFFDDENLLGRMSEFEMDAEYRRRAVDFAQANPQRAVELAIIKWRRYWSWSPNADQFQSWTMHLGFAAIWLPCLAFAFWGVWVMRGEWVALCYLAGPILFFAVLHSIFIGSLRYRLPTEYAFLILTARGIMQWTSVRSSRNHERSVR